MTWKEASTLGVRWMLMCLLLFLLSVGFVLLWKGQLMTGAICITNATVLLLTWALVGALDRLRRLEEKWASNLRARK